MDDRLQQRLDLFRAMPEVQDAVVDAVEHELALLAVDHRVDEDSAGMLASHLVAALGRAVRDEPEIDPPAPETYAQVIDEAPEAVDRAADVAARLEEALDVELPVAERQFLAFHLATLGLTASIDTTTQHDTEEHP